MKAGLLGAVAICMGIGMAQGTREIAVWVDGTRVTSDIPPVLVGARVLVPMRGVFQALDAQLEWDSATKTVRAHRDGGDSGKACDVELSLNSNQARVNGRTVTLDVPAQLYLDRVVVPLRFIGEAFGATVKWNSDTSNVIITTFPPPAK